MRTSFRRAILAFGFLLPAAATNAQVVLGINGTPCSIAFRDCGNGSVLCYAGHTTLEEVVDPDGGATPATLADWAKRCYELHVVGVLNNDVNAASSDPAARAFSMIEQAASLDTPPPFIVLFFNTSSQKADAVVYLEGSSEPWPDDDKPHGNGPDSLEWLDARNVSMFQLLQSNRTGLDRRVVSIEGRSVYSALLTPKILNDAESGRFYVGAVFGRQQETRQFLDTRTILALTLFKRSP
jgi:hypothetical protein